MPPKRGATEADQAGEVHSEVHETYNFADADLEIWVTAPEDEEDGSSDKDGVEDEERDGDAAEDEVVQVPKSERGSAKEDEETEDESEDASPVKYLVHKRNLIALSPVFEDLVGKAVLPAPDDASAGNAGSARKRPKVGSAQQEQAKQGLPRIELTEDSEVLDDLLSYFYRGKPHNLPLPDLTHCDFDYLMNLMRMAKKYEVVLVQDMLEERLTWIPFSLPRPNVG